VVVAEGRGEEVEGELIKFMGSQILCAYCGGNVLIGVYRKRVDALVESGHGNLRVGYGALGLWIHLR
jgi:hypothetical protein